MKKNTLRFRSRRLRRRIKWLVCRLATLLMWVIVALAIEFVGTGAPSQTTHDPKPPTTPQPTIVATTPPAPPEAQEILQARQILETMTLNEKICQLFIVTQDQLTGHSGVTKSGSTTRESIEKYPVGGIIYMSPNLKSREQCTTMIENIQSYSRLGLFISVDEEGGIVSRLGGKHDMGVTKYPSMRIIGQSGNPNEAYDVGYTLGTELAQLGFNLDFAPVADVDSNPNNPVIGERSFHSDPQVAAGMVAACVAGFRDSGTLCTLKHFPGHGDTETDTHYGDAVTDKTLEELEKCELLPFQSGIRAGAPLVMISHILTPNVTREQVPATLSYEIVTELLRNSLGFEGLIITDSMQMQAVTDRYDTGEATVKAIQAGVDIILMPKSLSDAIDGIQEALDDGTLTEERIDESVLRILTTKLTSGIITAEQST